MIAHLIALELQDEHSLWHKTFPGSAKLANRYLTSQTTVISALRLVMGQGLVVKHGTRYASVRQQDWPTSLLGLAADLAAAIIDRTLTVQLPDQRQISKRYNANLTMVSRAISILVDQGFVESDHRTVASSPPTVFSTTQPERPSRAVAGPRYARKTHERKVFSPAQLVVNDILRVWPDGLEQAGIHAPDDIAKRYKVSGEAAEAVFAALLDQPR